MLRRGPKTVRVLVTVTVIVFHTTFVAIIGSVGSVDGGLFVAEGLVVGSLQPKGDKEGSCGGHGGTEIEKRVWLENGGVKINSGRFEEVDNRVCELVSSDCVFFAVKDIEEGAVGSSCAVVTANNKHKVLKLANTSLQDTILKDTKRCNQY